MVDPNHPRAGDPSGTEVRQQCGHPTTQPDIQQEDATISTYNIIEPVDINRSSVEVLQLELLSNDDDEFYVGCMLDPRVTGVERVDYLLEDHSDFDKAVFVPPPGPRWTLCQ